MRIVKRPYVDLVTRVEKARSAIQAQARVLRMELDLASEEWQRSEVGQRLLFLIVDMEELADSIDPHSMER